MKKTLIALLFAAVAIMLPYGASAQAQSEEEQLEQMIEQQFDSYTKLYKLDDIQQFYLDSVLRYNYTRLFAELQELRKTGANSSDSYQKLSKKWQEITNAALKEKVFTQEQWERYDKMVNGRNKNRKKKGSGEDNQ